MMHVIDVLNCYGDILNVAATLLVFAAGAYLARKSYEIERLMAWAKHRDDVRTFANAVIDVMSNLEGLCETKPEVAGADFWTRRSDGLCRLSAFRDQGKFLIPNLDSARYGAAKSAAYRGIRQAALDCVTAAFYVVVALDYAKSGFNHTRAQIDPNSNRPANDAQLGKLWDALRHLPDNVRSAGPKNDGWSCKDGLIEAKRQFVSEIAKLIEPEEFIRRVHAVRTA